MGMTPALERAVAVQHRLTGRPPARPVYPDGLTHREVEVLRLVADGRSSREIGEELVLSVRTVERHVANIYLKTGTHGRAQVTATPSRTGSSRPLSSCGSCPARAVLHSSCRRGQARSSSPLTTYAVLPKRHAPPAT
jgi:DNA-binding CsgD family transcriptional regulator